MQEFQEQLQENFAVHIFDRREKGALPIVSDCHQDDSGTLGVVLDGSIAVTMCLQHPMLGALRM